MTLLTILTVMIVSERIRKKTGSANYQIHAAAVSDCSVHAVHFSKPGIMLQLLHFIAALFNLMLQQSCG